MFSNQKTEISNAVTLLTGFFKVILSIILIGIVIVWIAQIFHFDVFIPFYGSISAFLTDFNSHFVTLDIREESCNSIMYLSINAIIFIIAFSFIGDISQDMMKLYEKSHEEAIEEDNMRINEQIKKNYEFHLKHTMQFVVILRLKVFKDSFQNLAFSDVEYTQKVQQGLDKMITEVKSIVASSIKCKQATMGDDILFYIETPEQLNKTLVFLKSLCNTEKYVKSGLEYHIAVATYAVNEDPSTAINDATQLINLGCKNKMVCYQIVGECLHTVLDNKFELMANGNYEDLPDSLYELVDKLSGYN